MIETPLERSDRSTPSPRPSIARFQLNAAYGSGSLSIDNVATSCELPLFAPFTMRPSFTNAFNELTTRVYNPVRMATAMNIKELRASVYETITDTLEGLRAYR